MNGAELQLLSQASRGCTYGELEDSWFASSHGPPDPHTVELRKGRGVRPRWKRRAAVLFGPVLCLFKPPLTSSSRCMAAEFVRGARLRRLSSHGEVWVTQQLGNLPADALGGVVLRGEERLYSCLEASINSVDEASLLSDALQEEKMRKKVLELSVHEVMKKRALLLKEARAEAAALREKLAADETSLSVSPPSTLQTSGSCSSRSGSSSSSSSCRPPSPAKLEEFVYAFAQKGDIPLPC